MAVLSVQDRTAEFRQVLVQAQRRQTAGKANAQRQSLLSDAQKQASSATPPRKSDFARQAASIGRGIAATMAKLEKLAQLAKRRTLFDDRPVEVNELTFVIKQDLSALNRDISALQALSKAQHPRAAAGDQQGEHNRNVAILLQQRLTDVGANFQGVLEARTRNIAASKSRTENFISAVSAHTQPQMPHGASPLYATPSRSPAPGAEAGAGAGAAAAMQAPDTLSLNPMMGEQQLLLMEEGGHTDNTYIQQRSDAILNIEQTISELGGIFGQLAQMVQEQGNMIERIDANTEDVVDNVEGAQRELMKYWGRVSSNRWLLAKMFGVLMIFFLLWVLIAG
ncbi:hypothetical protein TD95_002883 [Thielaviopsis punctulata]|uniref:t-SNARE coiled-coil homology domain-containing protein n=1 Tax=Thielaviopsis punctulata TaxID=72032 RepID=A0A0F4ZF17_9PEZI|nr:hypothetical protein TD95_002883 [Thielaviopsis punctulata]